MQESKKTKKRISHPILALRYSVDVALYPSKEEKTPTLSKGGSANLRIDLLLTSILALGGAVACLISMLRRRFRKK